MSWRAGRTRLGFSRRRTRKCSRLCASWSLETIPSDPTRAEYRQGDTLGQERKHWFRAKFGGQRFRLFFRYDTAARIIIFAWVDDAITLRTYGARTDAYAVFRSMLAKGHPPDSWEALTAAAGVLDSARLREKGEDDDKG